ncbi:MAG: ATP-grasp domain-containing protein [Phycisphaerae bacterium]|nr:ATP-grasp domain-containing protein [Phycisphaerae bacterium]
MHAVVLHDDLPASARADEVDVFAQASEVETALSAMGYRTSRLSFSLDLGAVRTELRAREPDLVFNLVEAVAGLGRLLHLAPALLDTLRIPYTGAPTEAMFLTTNKLLAKRLLRLQGLPTPDYVEAGDGDCSVALRPGRRVIKPVSEDASVGLEDDAVVQVDDREELEQLIRARVASLGLEVFAEHYIEGREFNVSMLAGPDGPEVLPIAEIQFVDYASGRPRLVGYRAKWDAESFEYSHTPRRFDFPARDTALLEELERLAHASWLLFGVRGYARVDFRVDVAGHPWILEVNANPCLSPDAGFAAAANRAGLSSVDVVRRIVSDALQTGARHNR